MQNEEIVRRLDELRDDFKEFREHYLRTDVWQMQSSHQMERFGSYEKTLVELVTELKAHKADSEKRFDDLQTKGEQRLRQAVQIGVVALLGFVSSLAVWMIQLVAK